MPKRDPFGKKVFFTVGRDSDGCLAIYTPEQKRGEEPRVTFSPQFVKILLSAGESEDWPREVLKGIEEAMEKIEQQAKEEMTEEEGL